MAEVKKVVSGALAKQVYGLARVTLPDSCVARILELPEPAHKQATEFAQLMISSVAIDGLVNWHGGRIISNIKENEARYGENTIGQLAAIFGKTARWAYSLAKVYDVFSDEDHVKKLLSTAIGKDGSGGMLSFSHLVEVTRLSTASQQQKFLNMVIKQGLSVRDLAKAISEFLDGGRPVRTAAEKLDAVVSLFRQTPDKIMTFSNFVRDVPTDLAARLKDLVDESVTVDDWENVKRALENIEVINENLANLSENLSSFDQFCAEKFKPAEEETPDTDSAEESDVTQEEHNQEVDEEVVNESGEVTEVDDDSEAIEEVTEEENEDDAPPPPPAKRTLKAPKRN